MRTKKRYKRIVFKLPLLILVLMTLGMGPKVDIEQKKEHIVWPPPPDEPRIEYLYKFSVPDDVGIKKGFFRKIWEFIAGEETEERIEVPFGITTDASGKLYATDTARRMIHIFDLKNSKYKTIEGGRFGRFESPIGVAVDKEGNIYVTDSILASVFVFSEKGKYLKEIGKGRFIRPTGIAIERDAGLLYVVDTHAHKVFVFTTDGQLKHSFGENGTGPGQFNYPTNITIGMDRNLYVLDSMNFRVQIMDRTGQFISEFGRLGDSTGNFARPKGISTDSDGHIYVVDALFEAVQIFDKKGRLLLVFGSRGTGSGQFTLPAGIHIDHSNDKIYIADARNGRIQVFRYIKGNSQSAVNNLHQKK